MENETSQARNFDTSLKELEELVARLESGRLTLEESISAYEKGVKLVKFCTERLSAAEKKIELLKENPGQESPAWENYNPEEN